MQNQLKTSEKRAFQEWQALCERIRHQTNAVESNESEIYKTKRIKLLLLDFPKWCKYYFPHYMDAEFGWFHKKAAKEITDKKDGVFILEWAREHAKSVFANILMPLFLKAKGEVEGMVVVSANQGKAIGLLSDMQAELQNNLLYINDYGTQAVLGSWQDGNFVTQDGTGFWAFGRGQSPRGIRSANKRPNYAVIDDIDDKQLVKNEGRVRETVDWVMEDLVGALGLKGARIVVAGNRIHRKSVLSFLVGDIEEGDPKRPNIIHIKVYALENSKHQKDYGGTPAWKERYTAEQFQSRFASIGLRASRREYFHEHIEEGLLFQYGWIQYIKVLPPEQYDEIIIYGDPSFKDTKDSDYKAIITVGKKGAKLHILDAFVRQTTITKMVHAYYALWAKYENYARYYIEANMLQDMFLDEFVNVGNQLGFQLPIRADKRKKPDKYTRIENLTPLFENEHVYINIDEKASPDMQQLISQLLAFPTGSHDDAPDALEGATHFLQKIARNDGLPPIITGKYIYSNKRK
jgi:predicted phage terminase large subunit-like protein